MSPRSGQSDEVANAVRVVASLVEPGTPRTFGAVRLMVLPASALPRRTPRVADNLVVCESYGFLLGKHWESALDSFGGAQRFRVDIDGRPVTVYVRDPANRARMVASVADDVVADAVSGALRDYRARLDALNAAPLRSAPRLVQDITVTDPSIKRGTPILRQYDAFHTWRSQTDAQFATAIGEYAADIVGDMRDLISRDRASYAQAHQRGWTIEAVAVNYADPGSRNGRLRQRDVALLCRNGRPVEVPDAVSADGLRRSGTWTTTLADLLAIIDDAATIARKAPAPPVGGRSL